MASAREQIVSNGAEPKLGEVVQLAAKARPDLPEVTFHRVAAEVLASQPGSTGEAAREAIHREVARRLRIEPMVKRAMEEAFAAVLNEFRAATLAESTALESIGRQVHGVTGGQMRDFARRLRDAAPRPLTEDQILVWADAHHERTGDWPTVSSGPVQDAADETWRGLDSTLRRGLRGLPGGSSLAQVLSDKCGVRHHLEALSLTIDTILQWADAEHDRTGTWPTSSTGAVADVPEETWAKINQALAGGGRALPGGSSLARLLAEKRGVRNRKGLAPLTCEQILLWADAHHNRTGQWPNRDSGPIKGTPGETWATVNSALGQGLRGLPAGSSLAKLLADYREVRNRADVPDLTEEQILAWADAHHQRTGKWPRVLDGSITDAPGESWSGVQNALRAGLRGLTGGSSLAALLSQRRGHQHKKNRPPLTLDQILKWADAHYQGKGRWPNAKSGPVCGVSGETWSAINAALGAGTRGLPGNSSLAALLEDYRGVRNKSNLPSLSTEQILKWADAHFARKGHWPTQGTGPVVEEPSETWMNIHQALQKGLRGLSGGSSLAKLIKENRTTKGATPDLSDRQHDASDSAAKMACREGNPREAARGRTYPAVS
jgi:hypothetical protein